MKKGHSILTIGLFDDKTQVEFNCGVATSWSIPKKIVVLKRCLTPKLVMIIIGHIAILPIVLPVCFENVRPFFASTEVIRKSFSY